VTSCCLHQIISDIALSNDCSFLESLQYHNENKVLRIRTRILLISEELLDIALSNDSSFLESLQYHNENKVLRIRIRILLICWILPSPTTAASYSLYNITMRTKCCGSGSVLYWSAGYRPLQRLQLLKSPYNITMRTKCCGSGSVLYWSVRSWWIYPALTTTAS
jgi:hypothetical protein